MQVVVDAGSVIAKTVRVNTSQFDNAFNDELRSSQQVYDFLDDNIRNDTGGDSYYVHTQLSANENWVIVHNLNKMASVSVVDSAGTQVQGLIEYIDNNTIVVKFKYPFSGKAYLN